MALKKHFGLRRHFGQALKIKSFYLPATGKQVITRLLAVLEENRRYERDCGAGAAAAAPGVALTGALLSPGVRG